MEDNWIINIIENALQKWNSYYQEIISLLTQSPESFKNGVVWNIILDIHGVVKAIGTSLLVLFFLVGVVKTCGSFAELKRPEIAVKIFIRFAIAKAVVTYGLDLMLALFRIVQGTIARIMVSNMTTAAFALPQEIQTAITDLNFLQSIPLWAVSLIAALIIMVLSFICILSVYGRFFRIYTFAAISPIPLASFAGEPTASIGKAFIRSYAGVCLEGVVIVIACMIYSAFIGSTPDFSGTTSAVSMAWAYVGETVFNMLILVGLIKGSDKIVKEMLGL